MRISSIWALLGLTSAHEGPLPGPVAEILAHSMTKQFLVDVLSSKSLMGRRLRRQAECKDENANCTQFTEYCSNKQFLLVCRDTCNACGDQEPAPPAETSSASSGGTSDDCHDSMTYCGAMGMYCDNPDYKGVRMYCKKTCSSCNEDFTNVTEGVQGNTVDECEEREYCAQFSYCADSQLLKDRMEGECPVQCKAQKCKHIWEKELPKTNPKATTDGSSGGCTDESQACSGVAPLCQDAKYTDTLRTYCRKTCEFCEPQETTPDTDPGEIGECVNQYDNCDGMNFLCKDTTNEYSERYKKMCPVTCGLCTPENDVDTAGPTVNDPVQPASDVCEDAANNCDTLKEYCVSEQTSDMMKSQCRLTCGFCTPGGATVEQPNVPDNTEVNAPTQAPVVTTIDPNACEDDPALQCAQYASFCNNDNTDVPKKCRRTCGTCPDQQTTTTASTTQQVTQPPTTIAATTAGSCTIPAKDKMTGCGKYAKYCKAPRYKAKLTKSCPKTCKICVANAVAKQPADAAPAKPATPDQPATSGATPAAAAECKDGTPKKCPGLKRYCKLPKYKNMMKQKCSKTCGFCTVTSAGGATDATATDNATTSTECKNKATDDFCDKNKRRCSWPKYEGYMSKNCKKSCGKCN